MILNTRIWQQTVSAAKLAASDSPAWLRAVEKAAAQIESNPCITELRDGVLITSDSGNTYHANGVCQCKAFSFGQPCWHRAAAQLLTRYRERLAATPSSDAFAERERAPMVKREGNAVMIGCCAV
jgi:hypothetical protein